MLKHVGTALYNIVSFVWIEICKNKSTWAYWMFIIYVPGWESGFRQWKGRRKTLYKSCNNLENMEETLLSLHQSSKKIEIRTVASENWTKIVIIVMSERRNVVLPWCVEWIFPVTIIREFHTFNRSDGVTKWHTRWLNFFAS